MGGQDPPRPLAVTDVESLWGPNQPLQVVNSQGCRVERVEEEKSVRYGVRST